MRIGCPTPPDPMLPTSNVWFYCDDLHATHQELSARGVEFPQPPVELPFGWWSIFSDPDGNRFVLAPAASRHSTGRERRWFAAARIGQ
ncbi:MAG TPA: VOC family protein [Actinomycetes bacterium]